MNVRDRGRLQRHALEIGRMFYIGGLGIPGKQIAFRNRHPAPMLVALEDFAILLVKHLRVYTAPDGVAYFPLRRPDIAEVDGFAFRITAQWLARKIDVHATGQSVGYDQGRRSKIIGPHLSMNAPLEIAIA